MPVGLTRLREAGNTGRDADLYPPLLPTPRLSLDAP